VDDLQKDRQITHTAVVTVMDNLYPRGGWAGTGTAGPMGPNGRHGSGSWPVQPTRPGADVTQVMRRRW